MIPPDVAPDVDPYLLKHVTGSPYAAIAEWNLSDIERGIMRGRFALRGWRRRVL